MKSRRFLTVCVILLAACCSIGAAAPKSLPTLSASGYCDKLADISTALRSASGSDKSKEQLAANELEPIVVCAIDRPGAAPLVVHNEWLLANIDDAITNPNPAENKIAELISAVDEFRSDVVAKPIGNTDRSDAILAARQVLQSDVYTSDPVPPPSGLQKMLDRIKVWLDKHLSTKSSPVRWPSISIPKQVWEALLILLAVLVVGVVAWYIVGLIQTSAGGQRRRRPEALLAMTDEEAALVAARDFDKLIDLARLRADSGDYRSAFRLIYLAALVTLDTQGLVRLNRARTNWEYLSDLRNGPHCEFVDLLRPMTIDFDRIWYGAAIAGPSHFESAMAQYLSVKSAAMNVVRIHGAPAFAAPSSGGSR